MLKVSIDIFAPIYAPLCLAVWRCGYHPLLSPFCVLISLLVSPSDIVIRLLVFSLPRAPSALSISPLLHWLQAFRNPLEITEATGHNVWISNIKKRKPGKMKELGENNGLKKRLNCTGCGLRGFSFGEKS